MTPYKTVELLKTIEDIVERAVPIAMAKRAALGSSDDRAEVYPSEKAGEPYSDTYAHHLTAEGIEFVGCEMYNDWGHDSHRRTRTVVFWSELEHPEHAVKQYRDQEAKRKREQGLAAERSKREQLERLKRELGEA